MTVDDLADELDEHDSERREWCQCWACEMDPVAGSDYCKHHQLLEGRRSA
jgi:hypothetical protein